MEKVSQKPFLYAAALLALASCIDLRARDGDEILVVARGNTTCIWGSKDCNRCVVDVIRQVETLGREPTGRFTYFSGAGFQLDGMDQQMLPIKDFGEKKTRYRGHIQGFNRVPGLGGSDWIVASLSSRKKDRPGRPAGLLFARLSDIPGNAGLPLSDDSAHPDVFWVASQRPDGPKPPSDERRGRVFHKIRATKHPGGLQTIGQVIVVANYCNGPEIAGCLDPFPTAFVDFVQIEASANDLNNLSPLRLGRLLLGDIGFGPWKRRKKSYYVAITQMSNKHYLLMVNRSDLEHMQFFVSSTSFIDESTEWLPRGTRDFKSPTYQNMSFVTDCKDGELFLLGYKQKKPKWDGDNRIDLYRVVEKGRNINIEKVLEVPLAEADDTCEMKGGSGVFVTPGGQLVIYCSQGRSAQREDQDPLLLNFSEFTSPAPPSCGDGILQLKEQCDDGNTSDGVCTTNGNPCDNIGQPCVDGGICDFDGCSSFCGTTSKLCATELTCKVDADCRNDNLVCRSGCCLFRNPSQSQLTRSKGVPET